MKTKCPHCNYEWECGSEMMFVTCPNCRRKIERKKRKYPLSNSKEPLSKSLTLDKSKNINDANGSQ